MSKRIAANYNNLWVLLTGLGVGWLIGISVSPTLHIIVGSVIALVAGVVSSLVGLSIGKENNIGEKTAETEKPFRGAEGISINPLPLTVLVGGLVVGSSIGLYVRTNEWFGTNPDRFAQRWNGIGLDAQQIKRRLFDRMYPPIGDSTSTEQGAPVEKPTVKIEDPASMPKKEESIQPPTNANHNNPRKASKPASQSQVTNSTPPAHLTSAIFNLSVSECNLIRLKKGEELRTYLRLRDDKRIDSYLEKCQDEDNCLEALKTLICSKR